MSVARWHKALLSVAQRWTDPDHPPRAEAVERTLAGENRFTEEGLAFAINHGANMIANGGLDRWMEGERKPVPVSVGVCSRAGTPLAGLFEAALASLVSENVLVGLSPHSPVLVERFVTEVGEEAGEERMTIAPESELMRDAGAVIASGSPEDVEEWSEQLDTAGLAADRRLVRRNRLGVAVIDGTENRADLSGLAEDALLHEGSAARSVRLILAPEGLTPDPLLEALAGFREVFPPHELTGGSLAMKVAFLEAMGMPLAVGPGFVLTRGDLELQEGAHIRWVEYEELAAVPGMLGGFEWDQLFLSATESVAGALEAVGLPDGLPILRPGDAHRPEVGQPPLTPDVPRFLAAVARAT